MPPPRAFPLLPLASTVFPLTVLLRSVVAPKALMPPPLTSTEPRGAATWTWLSPMRLLVIVPPSNTLAPPRAVAFPAAELTSTLLPVMPSLLSAQGAGGQMSMLRPPWLAKAPPDEFVTVAALPEIVLLLIDADSAPPLMWIPAEGTRPKKKSLLTVALLFV